MVLLYLFLFNLLLAIRRDLRRAGSPQREPAAEAGPTVDGRLIVLSGGATGLASGQSLPLRADTLIGRGADAQVRLNDPLVSAHHARLRRSDGRWYVRDLESTNGTILNDQPVKGEQPVEYGDVLVLGSSRLKLAR